MNKRPKLKLATLYILSVLIFIIIPGISYAQDADSLWAWGGGASGQLGLDDTDNRLVPTFVTNASDWLFVSAGNGHTMVIKHDGTLWAWGAGLHGKLGLGDTDNRLVPTRVGTANNWASVSGGNDHTVAIKQDGTLWAWGSGDRGCLGLGDTDNRLTPTRVGTDSDWSSVAAGRSYTLALKQDGTLWSWGSGLNGRLGLGDTSSRYTPTQVGTASNWASVSTVLQTSLAIRQDGTLWSWGYGLRGRLGLGDDTSDRTRPTRVGTASAWSTVSAGNSHTLALKQDGALWGWGMALYGALGVGDSNTSDRNRPVRVGTDSDWSTIAAGGSHSLALKQDGTLWAWGRNYFGDLGLGDTYRRHTPTQVGTDNNWSSVFAGSSHSLAIRPLPPCETPWLDQVAAGMSATGYLATRSCDQSVSATALTLTCEPDSTWSGEWGSYIFSDPADAPCLALTPTILPETFEQGRWSLSGPVSMSNKQSGESTGFLPPGEYTLNFQAVTGFNTPSPITFNLDFAEGYASGLGRSGQDVIVEHSIVTIE